MEVLLTVIRAQVDKYAKFNVHGDAIVYQSYNHQTRKATAHAMGIQEGRRVFTDLYGEPNERWEVTKEYYHLAKGKAKAFARRRK